MIFYLYGAVLGFLGVAFGAFGAHGLKTRVSADLLQIFEVGVRYQMYHALALLILPVILEKVTHPLAAKVGHLWLAGVLIFSGSLYILTLTGIKKWGAVTPIGGLLLLVGWLCLILSLLQQK